MATEETLAKIRVEAGACGFITRISAVREGERAIRVEIESDCEAVTGLGQALERAGALTLREIVAKGVPDNRVLELGHRMLSHPACPIAVAVIKAAEVELGLNVPSRVTVEFETCPGDSSEVGGKSSAQRVTSEGPDDQGISTKP
jgi:hypothetical protein